MVSASDILDPLVQTGIFGGLLQNEYAQFGVIFVSFFIISGIFHFVLKGFFHKLTLKTKTDIDDLIFGMIAKPIFVIIMIFGLFLSLTTLSILEEHIMLIESGFFIVSVLIAAMVGTKVFGLVVGRALSGKGVSVKTPGLVMKMINVIIYLIALLAILNHFNVDVTAGIAALGVGGIAIGLALQGTLTNFFSGLHIVTDRPVNVGDYIEVKGEGVEGYITDIGWRSTKIRTLPNNVVIIPNSKLAESTIVNNHMLSKEMGFIVNCGVSYESDLEKVEKVTLEVARDIQKNSTGAVKEFNPLFRYKEFGDSNINFYVVLRVQQFVSKYHVKNEFIKELKKRFDKEGIEISWPVRKIFYGDKPGKK